MPIGPSGKLAVAAASQSLEGARNFSALESVAYPLAVSAYYLYPAADVRKS